MRKLLYLLPVMLLAFACGEGEPVEETTDTGNVQAADEAAEEVAEETEAEDGPPDTVRARHILVCYDGCAVNETFNRTQDEALELITSLESRIQNEEIPFVQAAIDYSDCPSGADGGMLGEFGRGEMVPPFEEAAFALPVGGMSGVVETQFGYHLILREN